MKNLWSNCVETPKNFLKKYYMEGVIKSEVSVESFIFDDWRDWFLTEKDKKTTSIISMNLYIDNDILIGKDMLAPINFTKLDFLIVLNPIRKDIIKLTKIVLEIPKLNILQETKTNNLVYIHPNDTVNIQYQFNKGEVTNAS